MISSYFPVINFTSHLEKKQKANQILKKTNELKYVFTTTGQRSIQQVKYSKSKVKKKKSNQLYNLYYMFCSNA